MLFDSRGWVFWVKLSDEDITKIECLRVVANFGTKIAITSFVWTIATRQLVMEGVWMVGRQNADIANTLQLRDVAMAIICWLSVGHNFSCMIAGDMLFDSWCVCSSVHYGTAGWGPACSGPQRWGLFRFLWWVFVVKLFHEGITEIEVLMDVAMATIFGLSMYGVHSGATWRVPLNCPCAALFGSRPSDHYFRSVCLFVCLCRVFLSRLPSDLDQTRTHVTCPGLVVSPRI